MVKAPRSEKEAAAEKRQATAGTGEGRRSLEDRGVCWRNRLRVTVWLLRSSAGVCMSAGLVLDSGNLHAPFPLHALQVVGWVDCMWTLAASGWSLCFCILTCLHFWTFFTPADMAGCYQQGEFTWSGVCLEELLLFDVCWVLFFFSFISGSAHSLSVPAHLFLCHTWTFRVVSTSSVSSALQNQILNKSGRSHWSYVTEEGRRAFLPSSRKLWVELQQEEFTNGPHG